MQLRLPASGARVGEDGSSLLDCADPCRGRMPLRRRTGRARVGEEAIPLLDCTWVLRNCSIIWFGNITRNMVNITKKLCKFAQFGK